MAVHLCSGCPVCAPTTWPFSFIPFTPVWNPCYAGHCYCQSSLPSTAGPGHLRCCRCGHQVSMPGATWCASP